MVAVFKDLNFWILIKQTVLLGTIIKSWYLEIFKKKRSLSGNVCCNWKEKSFKKEEKKHIISPGKFKSGSKTERPVSLCYLQKKGKSGSKIQLSDAGKFI